MRTWLHALPPEPHAPAASVGCQSHEACTNKRRAEYRLKPELPRARRKAGFRERLGARRTVAPLPESGRNRKQSAGGTRRYALIWVRSQRVSYSPQGRLNGIALNLHRVGGL